MTLKLFMKNRNKYGGRCTLRERRRCGGFNVCYVHSTILLGGRSKERKEAI
jgi:hypothetical protein